MVQGGVKDSASVRICLEDVGLKGEDADPLHKMRIMLLKNKGLINSDGHLEINIRSDDDRVYARRKLGLVYYVVNMNKDGLARILRGENLGETHDGDEEVRSCES